ncbi:hypothetical protein AO284_17325 [Pseudomonas sp. NZIPFR-PS2]|nr:hypothetical protein AO284_17325 [Pseudomonas sp. NZIPFR-PS2]
MKRIWRMAGVGLLMVTVGAQAVAEERDNGPRGDGGGQHERGPEGGRPGGNEQPRPQNNPSRPQNNQHPQGNEQGRPQPQPQPSNNLPIQSRPDTVRQTQEPRQGYYRDIPRRNDGNPHWEAGGPGSRPGDNRWPGRPDGHGNGWGPGPQHRPGYVIDRFPDRNYRVPYRGQDYFYSGGYWYRPQGPRYVVVTPPYGIRVHYLPDYAREVWVGGALFFLAAGAYYTYESSSQQYVVVQPPAAVPAPQPAPQGNGYDVVAYPANGQSPAQVQQDGYDCYRWAVQQSGFDPQQVTYAPDPAVVQTYRQAQGNCLSSRGYQVQY